MNGQIFSQESSFDAIINTEDISIINIDPEDMDKHIYDKLSQE
jgi:hypothetical protein